MDTERKRAGNECPCCSGGLIWLGSLKRLVNCPACRGTEGAGEIGEHEKRCGRCGHVKPHSEFNAARKNRDGLRSACRSCTVIAGRRYITAYKAPVFDHYGWSCACCGTTDDPTIDHVNGDGREHRAEVGGSQAVYRWLIANGFPEGFQTLCFPCNDSKRDGSHCRRWHGGAR